MYLVRNEMIMIEKYFFLKKIKQFSFFSLTATYIKQPVIV